MKKILHISKYYYPYVGGTEVTAQYLAEGLNDFENVVVCFNEHKENKEDLINGIKVFRIKSDFIISNQAISFSYYKVLNSIIKEYKPDFVHLHCPNPFVYFVLLSILPSETKLVLHWHLDIVKQKIIHFFVKPIEKKILRRADVICTTSPNYKNLSKTLSPYKNKIEILQSAIKSDNFDLKQNDIIKIKDIKQKYGNRKLVFFIGRHVEYKGLKYLIEAEKYINSDCHIIIAGKGPLTECLKAKANLNRISFVGRLNDEDLRCYLHAADVFAFPSITKNEAFGLALAEAMYCECPAVTFHIEGSGVNWVSLNSETGLEVENSNSVKYGEAIDILLKDNALRLKYAKAAKKRVLENFVVEKEQEKAKLIYNNLC